jgi:hypothetical protein
MKALIFVNHAWMNEMNVVRAVNHERGERMIHQ